MTKISLHASKLHFFEKVQSFFASSLFKKSAMAICFVVFLVAAIAIVLSFQHNAAENSAQDLSLFESGEQFGTNATDNEDERIETGRNLMLEIEELATIELARILKVHFGSENDIEGSIHYDLLSADDYSSPLLTNWINADGVSALIQSEDFSVETSIMLRFTSDEQVNNFELQEIQNLFDKICQVDIVKSGQKISILLKGPEVMRLFYCPQIDKDSFDLEEVAIN